MDAKNVRVGFGVMILNEGKVLLGQRHHDPAKADSELHGEGTWTMPGGKLEYGESFEEGVVREVLEETGLAIDPEGLKFIALNNDRNEHAHFITIGFLYEAAVGAPRVMEPDEIVRWGWFPLNNLPEPLFFPSHKVIQNYLQKEIYIK